MDPRPRSHSLGHWLIPTGISVALSATAYWHYPLFHLLAEGFTVGVSALLLVVTWYTRNNHREPLLNHLGAGFIWVALIDLLHTLSYKGMELVPGLNTANVPTQLWLAGRLVQALILISAFLVPKAVGYVSRLVGFGALSVILIALVALKAFPDSYIESGGLTEFKVLSEYFIIALLATAGLLIPYRKDMVNPKITHLLLISLVLTGLSEICFTLYVDVFDIPNQVGHLLKIFAFWSLFEIILRQAIERPLVDLQESRERAQAASQVKSDFLAMMSHEIRTPMNVVIGMTDALRDTSLNDEQRNSLEKIQIAGGNLLDIINQILDLSKIEAGQFTIMREPVRVRDVVDEVCALLKVLADGKGLALEERVDPTMPEWILSDRVRLHQILFNLIGNAIKFTDHGKVTIDVRYPGDGSLHFKIRDTGSGISPEQLSHIFEPFVQGDNSLTRRHGGTGLGLAISRRLIELLKGRIQVESQLGLGTTFLVTLPAEVALKPPSPLPHLEKPSPQILHAPAHPVLLVEDMQDNQLLVRTILKRTPVELQIVENGEEAVKAIKAHPYSVILMDVQMPVMDGYTATREIRQWETRTGHNRTPIIALTANALEGEGTRSLEAGCDYYLPKPITKKDLVSAIQRFTG